MAYFGHVGCLINYLNKYNIVVKINGYFGFLAERYSAKLLILKSVVRIHQNPIVFPLSVFSMFKK